MYEWRSHTSEAELLLVNESEVGVFGDAVDAFGRLVELDGGGTPATHRVDLEAADRPSLLVELFQELIFLAETEGFVPDRASLELDDGRLRGTLEGRRTSVRQLVKAATYHGLSFDRKGEAWEARIVLDV